jgi:hypothetical protein
MNPDPAGGAAAGAIRSDRNTLHCIDEVNSKFTVLKNSGLRRYLRNRINCAEILQP